MDWQAYFSSRNSRRSALRQLGALAGVGLALDACTIGSSPLTATPTPGPSGPGSLDSIQHVVIACQENRTFDTYFGYYPRTASFGVPRGYSQPDGTGGSIQPYHFRLHINKEIAHDWQTIHREWNHGKMDGFYLADGKSALGYYDRSDLPYYYALADAFTLCGNYFCYQLGPTLPNRVALWAGTTSGMTQNHKPAPGSLDFPTIIDLLEDHGVSWNCYNLGLLGLGSTPELEFLNAMPFFKRWYQDKLPHPRSPLRR